MVVATDSPEIEAAVKKAGGRAVMTGADHASGSDRIFEALGKVDPAASAAIVVNVQGDLPTLEPSTITAAAGARWPIRRSISARRRRKSRGAKSATTPQWSKSWARRSRRRRLRALYFTRATAPAGDGPLYHHIGLYAFRRAALERFVELPPSPLEQREKLEQLRALEAGMRIDVAIVDAAPLGVDTPGGFGARARHAIGIAHEADARRNRVPGRGRAPIRTSPATRPIRGYEPLPCPTFEDAFAAVRTGRAALGMIPIDNSVAGRVADIHHLMPRSGLHIVGEWFLPVQHQLMAPKGATLRTIKTVESHVHALGQCRNIIRTLRRQGGGRRRHRRRGARSGGGRRHDARGAGDQARGATSTGCES